MPIIVSEFSFSKKSSDLKIILCYPQFYHTYVRWKSSVLYRNVSTSFSIISNCICMTISISEIFQKKIFNFIRYCPSPKDPTCHFHSPCSLIHPFPLPCSGIPLHWCFDPFQHQCPLLSSCRTSFSMWIVSFVSQDSRLISTYQWVHTMGILLSLGYLT